jgi:hypothetical protein
LFWILASPLWIITISFESFLFCFECHHSVWIHVIQT